MNECLRSHAEQIIGCSIAHVMPGPAVERALRDRDFGPGRLILVAVGKGAWPMAKAAWDCLGERLEGGIVITKQGQSGGAIGPLRVLEGAHPVPDETSFAATEEVLALTQDLREGDTVLFLLSGGASALFEKPLIPPEELRDITGQLLSSGADIVEVNTIRKRLSAVKGGRFALHCAPAKIFSVVLSDVVGDRLDMIASGPAAPDGSTCAQALEIAGRYGLKLSPRAGELLEVETAKALGNVETVVTGSVGELCRGAAQTCRTLGYEPLLLTDCLSCEAREAGTFLANMARSHQDAPTSLALIAGGETVVRLTGKGKGGRNQELALSAARGIDGLRDTAVFSVGSDGTDGPTDAAGGYVDGETLAALEARGLDVCAALRENDAYHALEAVGGLVVTGPTGTNVNDVAVALLDGRRPPAETAARRALF